jgi:hypothetical protein
MTQIVSQLWRGFAVLVEDRLVSAAKVGGKPNPFDTLANKNIIYWARDAIVCMGYTGPAFVGSLTTDTWIAEKLTCLNLSEQIGMRTGPLPQWLDVGQALRLLERELKASEIAIHRGNFELVVLGWQWKKGSRPLQGVRQPVPMYWSLRKPSGKGFDGLQRLPRYWHWPNGRAHFTASPEGNLSQLELAALASRLRGLPPDQFEQTIVDAIRAVSARNAYVGPNCISILLAPPHICPFVRVTFFPQEQHTAKLVSSTFVSPEYPAAFSPWVIGQGMVFQPSVLVGQGWELQMGPFKIALGGFGTQAFSGMSSQRRPTRPT